jgi:hypothetical protein
MADDHAILVVADAVVILIIELVDLDLVAVADQLKLSVCQWVIAFMPSIMALMPSLGVRPEGPVTRSGFQRPDQAEKL